MNEKIIYLSDYNIIKVNNYLSSLGVDSLYGKITNYDALNEISLHKNLSINKMNHELMYAHTYKENCGEIKNGLFTSFAGIKYGYEINEFVTDYYNCKIFGKNNLGYFNKFDYDVIKQLEEVVGEENLANAYFNSNIDALYERLTSDTLIEELNTVIKIIEIYYNYMMNTKRNKTNNRKLYTFKDSIIVTLLKMEEELNEKKEKVL